MLDRKVLKDIPNEPGVYIFKNKDSKPIYIGKAKKLKNRVSSYFNPSNQEKNEKIKLIVEEAEFLDYIVVRNEDEALILESNLIFNHKPKYNILLKDTRVYPYIAITKEDFPLIKLVRTKKGENAFFYGPYSNVSMVRGIIEIIQWVYKVRTCERNLNKKSKPCFLYHLGKCFAPCYVDVDKKEYNKAVRKVKKFLNGDVKSIRKYIEDSMKQYAKILNFERAAQLRDLLFKLDKLFMPIGVEIAHNKDVDIIAIDNEYPIAVLIIIRHGYVISKLTFTIEGNINDFLHQYYIVRKNILPEEIWIKDLNIEKIDEDIKHFFISNGIKELSNLSEKSSELLEIINRNLEEEVKKQTDLGNTLKQAKEILSLKKIPYRMEGIDISHLQGLYTVASLITFENGKPKKDDYRRYRLDEFKEPNDFESIRTVIKRRYTKHPLPDLLFIDGGKGQVNSAVEALKEIGYTLDDVDVVGIAKEDERIVFPGDIEDLHLPLDHPVLRMLIFMRDETHRFAITFNRKLRAKRFERSKLDDIPGIGPKRKKALINHFGSIENISKASWQEINKVINNEKVAKKIKEFFD
ncbi:excinuclease ABC, C subunit [Marinitoga piezophila KA3]|uniref:UvrABC system protein C n=1 Tax=Marinitoga piezophila (strain DSM 14283 / JCM 11233 / KA3) TaxID=443254 RepID=H2J700_MARPK|nr:MULTISPECIES: excinuclease ABC subunit UvrC [Marinitoga]AEX86370.1 excinuclease ABC, C subunit [Marinitoga piezophila KA3]NUU98465.1 excinuclease ABC subunit C [Marinitoga sp. 1138]